MTFPAEIHFAPDQEKVEGAQARRIQADNHSQNASKLIPVRITISRVSALERACAIVAALAGQPEFHVELASGQSGSMG